MTSGDNYSHDHNSNTTTLAAQDQTIMPHRTYSREQMDIRYPSLEAVEAVDDDREEPDELLQAGEKVAQAIMEQANAAGRRRVTAR